MNKQQFDAVNVTIDPEVSEEQPETTDQATCTWQGADYSVGAEVCMGGTWHVCMSNGQWQDTGRPCSE